MNPINSLVRLCVAATVVAAAGSGCLDARSGAGAAQDDVTTSPPDDTTATAPDDTSSPDPAPALVGALLVELALPNAGDCAAEALSAELAAETPGGGAGACLAEAFVDGCIEDRTRQTYDAAGRPLHSWYELLDLESPKARYVYGPPTIRLSQRWTYDDRGDVVRHTRADTPDAAPYVVTETSRDAAGRDVAVEVHWYDPDPGLFGSDRAEYWTYDEPTGEVARHELHADGELYDGEVTVFDRALPVEIRKLGPDGAEWLWKDQIFDADGQLVELWSYSRADVLAAITRYEYDGAGALRRSVKKRMDAYRWVDVHEYDAAGRETRYTQDEDADGKVEYIREADYDAAGHAVRTYTGYDMDAGGVPQRWAEAVTTRDAEGRPTTLTQRQRSFNNSRTPKYQLEVNETRYTYSDDGTRVVVARFDGAGTPRGTTTTVYLTAERASDQKVSEAEDRDGDGVDDLRQDWTWRADGQLAQRLEDTGVDGDLDEIERWIYDAAGRLVRHAYDDDGDGVADWRTELRYACGGYVVE